MYKRQVVYCEPGPESKQRLVKGEAFLDFQVGRSAILPDFRHNGEELGKIRAVIDRIRRYGDGEITDIFIEGYASPDGNAERNAGLSLARAKALKDYLQRAYELPEGIFRVSSVGEDWSCLLYTSCSGAGRVRRNRTRRPGPFPDPFSGESGCPYPFRSAFVQFFAAYRDLDGAQRVAADVVGIVAENDAFGRDTEILRGADLFGEEEMCIRDRSCIVYRAMPQP